MNKFVGAIGLATLLFAIALLSSNLIANANGNDTQEDIMVVETDKIPEVLTYEELCKLYSCKEDVRVADSAIVELSQEDAVLLMKMAYHEDHTDAISQAYIMSEILNRVNSPKYPNTIRGVLNQKKQFLNTESKEFQKITPDVNSHIALFLIESGQIETDFLYHESLEAENSWQSKHREMSMEYGGTRFYR